MPYKVIVNGKDSGIVETNYQYAKKYWDYRARISRFRLSRITGKKIVLRKIA